MHIEPEIVQGAKIVLSYGTAVVSFGIAVKSALESIQKSWKFKFYKRVNLQGFRLEQSKFKITNSFQILEYY